MEKIKKLEKLKKVGISHDRFYDPKIREKLKIKVGPDSYTPQFKSIRDKSPSYSQGRTKRLIKRSKNNSPYYKR